jgi:Uma2 family endonuclease
MGLPAQKHRTTVAEYLLAERQTAERHEYRNGDIVLMAGGTGNHSLIMANVIIAIGGRLKGSPCRVYESNLRIGIAARQLYTYPDITVICGPRQTDPVDEHGETFCNPKLIVEVISPATEAYDRGAKFTCYRELESFQEYVLVAQDAARVETFFRQADGTWLFTPATGLTAVAPLRSLGLTLPLAEVYDGVVWPEGGGA